MPFPRVTDPIGGPHQRRHRPHAEHRYSRRERALVRHQLRSHRKRERVPILEQLRQGWGYMVLWVGIGLLFAVVFVVSPVQGA